jgi:MFS family permease
LAALVLIGAVQMWMVYLFSLAFGVISGLFQPASLAMVPNLVHEKELQAGNAIFQGSSQLAGFIGPALAGGVIGWFAHSATHGPAELTGIGLAFAIDGLTFVVSVLTLWAMLSGRQPAPAGGESVWQAIASGLRFAWREPPMRVMLIAAAMANLFFAGPMLVGIPVLASVRLPEGAAAFGLIMSAYAGGNVIGILVTGSLPKPNGSQLRLLFGGLLLAFALAQAAFGWIQSTWAAFGVLLLLGVGNGYFMITVVTLLQRLAPKSMLGRMMSLMLFASNGLMPVSQAAAGAITRWSLTGLFVISGVLMLLLAVCTAVQPALLQLNELLARAEAE